MQLGKSSKKCSTEEEAVQHIDQELDKAVREGEITRGLAQRYAKPRPSAVVGVTYDSSQRHWKADRGADPPRPHGLPRVRDTFPTRQQAEARIWSAYMEEQRAAVAGAAGSGIGGMRVQQLLLLLPQSVEQWRQRARAPAHSVPAEELSHMRKLGYDTSTPLYAASGLLSYNDTNSLQSYTKLLRKDGVCSKVVVKEDYLSSEELAGLHSEQKALLDLLVLTQADKFVGTKRSAFSYMARELRQLAGKSASSTRLHPVEALNYDVVLEISRENR